MAKKRSSMFTGRGNFFHDSATYRLKPKYEAMFNKIGDMKYRDYQYALKNQLILVQEKYMGGNLYHGCLFCEENNPDYNKNQLLSLKTRDTELLEISRKGDFLYYRCPQCHFIKIKHGIRLIYEDLLEEYYIIGIIGKNLWNKEDLLKTIYMRALSKKEVWIRLYKYFRKEFSIMKHKVIIKKYYDK